MLALEDRDSLIKRLRVRREPERVKHHSGQAPGLANKYSTRLERLARYEHSSLFVLWPVLSMFYDRDRNDSGQYYKITIMIIIDDPS